MYENFGMNERQTVPNGNSKLYQNKFTKSLTSFHTKRVIAKNKTSQNTLKNSLPIKYNKYPETKRIYFSSKKAKDLGYLITNPISPQNNNKYNEVYENQIKMQNLPSSDKRLYKYKKEYILNDIKNYHPDEIIDNKTKINIYKNKLINDKKLNNFNDNNISNNDNENNNKKINGALNNNNNLNNSLIHSTDNFLNSIAFTLTNNNKENSVQSNYIKFNGLNSVAFGSSINKSLSNLNDFTTFNSRNKILKKLKDKNNLIYNNKKDINSQKNQNLNNIKKTSLFKDKSKTKMKSNLSSNKISKKKKTHKSSSSLITNTISNNYQNEIIKDINNKDYNNFPLDESDKIKINVESNVNNTNSYSNINTKDLFYETVDENQIIGGYMNNNNFNFINIINASNRRNNDLKREGLNSLKTSNTMKSYDQSVNISNNIINDNNKNIINNNININKNNIIENIDKKNNIAYQTYSGPFRKNIIKVNIIEKNDNNQIRQHNNASTGNIDNDIINNNQKRLFKNNKGTKSANNLKTNINNNTSIKKSEKKNIFIDTELNAENKKNLKKNITNINKFNKNNILEEEDKKNKNSSINNSSPEKRNFILYNEKFENNIKSNIKQKNYQNCLIYSKSNLKPDKSSNIGNITNTLNFNIYPLSRDSSHAYIKKNSSSNLNNLINNGNPNLIANTNRSSVYRHKKNNSISSSIFNSLRISKDNKLNMKNKNNSLYSSPNNRIEKYINNKSVVIPELTVKLENIKSRVSNLLNIYSLLALRSINNNNNNIVENE